MYYTGVGARETPSDVLDIMTSLGEFLDDYGYTLRSGGAVGADSAFEKRALNKEIYLPTKGFNHHDSALYGCTDEAYKIASKVHPAWHRLNPFVRKLHGRNAYQVLGKDLNTYSHFVICWTRGGLKVGGTATAIEIAEMYNIPVFNLANTNPEDIIRYALGY